MNTIFTAGYTGSTPEDLWSYAHALKALIVDVRLSARSRVPHWNGARLEARLGSTDYWHMPEFGNLHYKTPGAPIVLNDPDAGLAAMLPVLAVQPVILLCGCAYKARATCHRLVVADLLAEATGASVVHLPTRFSEWSAPDAALDTAPVPQAEATGAGYVSVLKDTKIAKLRAALSQIAMREPGECESAYGAARGESSVGYVDCPVCAEVIALAREVLAREVLGLGRVGSRDGS